jgi:hypothetical protein
VPRVAGRPGFFRAHPLALWFCGLALLGMLRFAMKLSGGPLQSLDAVAWAWFAGSVVLGIIGIVLLLRGLRQRRRADP